MSCFRKLSGRNRQRVLEMFGQAQAERFEAVRSAMARLSRREVEDEEVRQAILSVPPHYAGMSSVVAQISAGFNWTCQNNLTGGTYNPTQQSSQITKSMPFGTAKANNAANGGDEVFSFQQSIAAGASATINLNAMTNLLAQTSVAITRIKGMMIRLLSAADDSTITPAPTATSTMCVTNNGIASPSPLDFSAGGTNAALNLTVNFAGGAVTAVAVGTAGSGYLPSSHFLASPVVAGASGSLVLLSTNAAGSVNTATFIAALGGSGYSNSTNTASVAIGQYTIATGGAHVYFDPIAAGFLAVGATSQILLQNLDSANAITCELDFLAATS